ncbi:alpha/beta hydrolase family protein [Nonomuraea sp. NPDC050310]|uniref:alpha/beta hydrolase n=1 Tax=Nonomuraea sp. NPDC050310 TaxID=3154935 RepID=UPI0033C3187C
MIKRLLLALVLFLPGCAPAAEPYQKEPHQRPPAALKVVGEEADGRQRTLTVESPALGGEATVEVLLPKGWREGSRHPLLLLLEGCCHTGVDWISRGHADDLTEDLDLVVVVPEGGRAGFYSDWAKGPKWESFHLTELLPLIERKYGATDRRAVAGLSMGGFGALSYAARHPGLFRAAASFSGLLDASRSDADYIAQEQSRDLWADDAEIARRNPTALAAKLKGLPVYVSCGNGEPGPLDSTTSRDDGEAVIERRNRTFVEAARKAGVRLTVNLYGPGTHAWPYWTRELEKALPMLVEAVR